MRCFHWLILVVSLAAVASSSAAPAAQRTGAVASKIAEKTFEASVRARVDARRAECMSAIGNLTFCHCIAGDLPLDVDFQRYIAVTTSVVNHAYSDQLSPDDKSIALRILSTRDRCVAAAFGTPQK